MKKIKVLVADRLPILAYGLAQVLSADERIEVINQAYTTHDVIAKAEKTQLDIIIIDAQLLSYEGVRVTKILRELQPGVKFIILTSPEDAKTHLDIAVNVQTEGFLLKTIKPGELVECVIETVMGGTAFSPKLMSLILDEITSGQRPKEVAGMSLSIREMEIIEKVAEGMGNREIAETLFTSENTVKGHLRRICGKLKVNNRVEVARYLFLNGLPNRKTESKKH